MFGILDGHGVDGHYVSNYAKDKLIDEFEFQMKLSNKRKLLPSSRRRNSKNGFRETKNSKAMHSLSKRNWNTKRGKVKSNVMNSIEVFNTMSSLGSDGESSCSEIEIDKFSRKQSRAKKRGKIFLVTK